eukprot:1537022-Karenia_brevis.AAC.1
MPPYWYARRMGIRQRQCACVTLCDQLHCGHALGACKAGSAAKVGFGLCDQFSRGHLNVSEGRTLAASMIDTI